MEIQASAQLNNENKERWQFIAPMRTIKSPSALPSGEDQETLELLGYVLVDIDKASLRSFITTDARRYQSTGLGLAISKGYCELMEGRILVESKRGSGSTFTVVIPLSSPPTRGSTSTPPG